MKVKSEVIHLDSPRNIRVKLRLFGEVVGLGRVECYEELTWAAQQALEAFNVRGFYLAYLDEDGDSVTVSTQNAFERAVGAAGETLYLTVVCRTDIETVDLPYDLEFAIKKATESIGAVFRVISSSRVTGLGCLLPEGVGLVPRFLLPDIAAAETCSALFEDPGFLQAFDATRFEISGELVCVGFRAPQSITAKSLNAVSQQFAVGGVYYTLAKPSKKDIKANLLRVEVREVSISTGIFITKEACGPVGSPLFDESFHLAGIMLTECANRSEATNLLSLSSLSRFPIPFS